MQQVEKMQRILMGQTPGVRESNIFRVFIEISSLSDYKEAMPYHYVEATNGADVVAQCLSGLNHRCVFDLIVLSEFSGSADNMRIGACETARMIRVLKAYQDVPIIVVNYDKHLNLYRLAGITTWIHVHASHDEFVAAIQASILKMKGIIPPQTWGENWTLVPKEPQE